MIIDYIHASMKRAEYEILDDKSIYAEIPILKGVYANADTFEECRNELMEILEEWIFIRLRQNLEIPVIDNIDLNIAELADATN